MGEIEKSIIRSIKSTPGISDRELAMAIKGRRGSAQYINQSCRKLAEKGIIRRRKREDGLIGNWILNENYIFQSLTSQSPGEKVDEISEKKLKQILESYLIDREWNPQIAWGKNHGIDIEARHGPKKWIIEVRGAGAYNPVQLNNFHSVLGEVLQRMDDPDCKYSVALPDIGPFRRLWERLPLLAKTRTGITILFINPGGTVKEVTV